MIDGTNKLRELKDDLEKYGIDPLTYIVDFLTDTKIDKTSKARMAADILPYIYPKKKVIETKLEHDVDWVGIISAIHHKNNE